MYDYPYKLIEIEEDGGILNLFLNRPDKRNAMNQEMFRELDIAFNGIRDAPSVKVCIISGRGSAFSAGLDLSSLDQFKTVDATTFRILVRSLQRTYRILETMEKPVIAAVNGPALGSGMELALACDMILASDRAIFGLPEVNYGLVTDLGATQRLPRIVGTHRAKELIMTGRRISADEAFRMGMVNAVYPPEKLEEETHTLALKLRNLPQPAVGLCKIAIDRSFGNSIDSGLEYEAQSQTICFQTITEMLRLSEQTGRD